MSVDTGRRAVLQDLSAFSTKVCQRDLSDVNRNRNMASQSVANASASFHAEPELQALGFTDDDSAGQSNIFAVEVRSLI